MGIKGFIEKKCRCTPCVFSNEGKCLINKKRRCIFTCNYFITKIEGITNKLDYFQICEGRIHHKQMRQISLLAVLATSLAAFATFAQLDENSYIIKIIANLY